MRFLIVAHGSYGDINPNIAIALELKKRGHDAVFIGSEYYQPLTQRVGLEMASTQTREEYLRVSSHPDFAHPRKMWKLLAQEVIDDIRPTYQTIAKRYEPGNTVVLAPTSAYGARTAHDKLGVPIATINIVPHLIRTVHVPLAISPAWFQPLPMFMKKELRNLTDRVTDRALAKDTNVFRSELGLKPVQPMQDRWVQSPSLILGLFPEWYYTPQPDWPPHARLTGFTMYDGPPGDPLGTDIEQFLAAGEPPVVINALSAMRHSSDFFDVSVEALRRVKRRGILLTPFADSVPKNLPAEIAYFGYVPHNLLLPRAAAIIHQGGIGTMAQAIKSGIPQLIVPLTFDQPANARRISALGLGASLSLSRYKSDRVAQEIERLLVTDAIKENCLKYATLIKEENGVHNACDVIEETFVSKRIHDRAS